MFELTEEERAYLRKKLVDDDYGRDGSDDEDRSNRVSDSVLEQYEAYVTKQTYGRLMKFKIEMYRGFYRKHHGPGSPYPTKPIFTAMKKRLDDETVRLGNLLVQEAVLAGRAVLAFPFSQGAALQRMESTSGGVCQAMAADWLRRMAWNATHDESRWKRSFDRVDERKLMTKMLALQRVGSYYSKDNLREMEDVLRNDFRGSSDQRGFRDLLAFRTGKMLELPRRIRETADETKDEDETSASLPTRLTLFLSTQLPKCPRALLWEYHRITEGALAGHAVALFQPRSDGPWRFFDANYGEYEVAGDIALFMSRWYKIYKPYGTVPHVRAFAIA
ncbi:MAG: hypothetical protein FJ027_10140 [Candidatus Rokubacteria bacterium]|nr:hypothetical protein [Candidatus Rokubacteria bacterium]